MCCHYLEMSCSGNLPTALMKQAQRPLSEHLEACCCLQPYLSAILQMFLDRLLEQCGVKSLHVSMKHVEVDPESVGIVGREHEYEGGFVMLTITHK